MKQILTVVFVLLLSPNIFSQKNEVIIIGNVHTPMPNYNADTLYNIMGKIQPDIILHEIDSSFFTTDFKFNSPSKENEQTASTKYREKHPAVMIRPFEFEGRNEYRRKMGIKQSEGPAMNLLDSLYKNGKLNKEQTAIVTEYNRLTEQLNSFGYLSAQQFNNSKTDSISQKRQYYQHYEIRKVIGQRKEFVENFVTTSTNEKITLAEGYNRFCDFWDLRNKTMAKNILAVILKNPGKRIIVLTGYFHRYYLLSELRKTKPGTFIVKEFYQ